MELKQIKELMAAMGRTGIKKLLIKQEGIELQLERGGDENIRVVDGSRDYEDFHFIENDKISKRDLAFARAGGSSLISSSSLLKPSISLEDKESEDSTPALFIKSPMVGTFYASPSPENPPFIKVGDVIREETVVCVIEAMKVMNEIKAGVSGTVKEILIENSHPVEFGSLLFKIV